MRLKLCVALLTMSFSLRAQKELNATSSIGKSEGSVSFSFGKDWGIFKSKKLAAGIGVRFTSYFGANQYYRTAPAELTSGKTGPFVIFSPDVNENIDTFLIKSPQVNSVNLMINIRYKVSNKFVAGFNIDVIGFSFGQHKKGEYIDGSNRNVSKATPTSFNVLLTSDNDKGSLNSECYGKYFLSDKWGIKAGVQFHFTEYTTDTKVQQYPKPNDRFRNKSLMFLIGAVYQF